MIAVLTKLFQGAQTAGHVARRRLGDGDTATLFVRLGRVAYTGTATFIVVAWYSGWRNERVAPGELSFPFPGVEKLGKQFGASRQSEDINVEALLAGAGKYAGAVFAGAGAGAELAPGNVNDLGRIVGKPSATQVGRDMQTLGYQVGEHPNFGGVSAGHSANSLHYKGLAFDLNAALPSQEAAAAHLLVQKYGISAFKELIWAGDNPVSIADGKVVPSTYWGEDTWNDHKDHVHAGFYRR